MNPEQSNLPPFSSLGSFDSPSSGRSKKPFIILAAGLVFLLVVLALFMLGKPSTKHTNTPAEFSMTGTSPSGYGITTQVTTLAVNFNRQLSSVKPSVTSNPSIISSTSVSGKTLTISFTPDKLTKNTRYSITIASISDTTGQRLTNQKLVFTPAFQPPTFTGESGLYDKGLSTDQVQSLESYISDFKPWASSVSIDQASINHYKDRNSAFDYWHIAFTMDVDGTTYNVVTNYTATLKIQVIILDPASGNQLFEEGGVDQD